jgi:hypothetical protein
VLICTDVFPQLHCAAGSAALGKPSPTSTVENPPATRVHSHPGARFSGIGDSVHCDFISKRGRVVAAFADARIVVTLSPLRAPRAHANLERAALAVVAVEPLRPELRVPHPLAEPFGEAADALGDSRKPSRELVGFHGLFVPSVFSLALGPYHTRAQRRPCERSQLTAILRHDADLDGDSVLLKFTLDAGDVIAIGERDQWDDDDRDPILVGLLSAEAEQLKR